MEVRGNIDTDRMYPGKYLVSFEPEEVGKHALEGLDPEFAKKAKKRDIVVFGRNAGCVSARGSLGPKVPRCHHDSRRVVC